MSFHDLPDDLHDHSLRDRRFAADFADLLMSLADRRLDTLLILPCDSDGYVYTRTHLLISDMAWHEGVQLVSAGLSEMADLMPLGSTIVLATSHGGIGVPELHQDWLRDATRLFSERGVEVIGTYTADCRVVHAGRLPTGESTRH